MAPSVARPPPGREAALPSRHIPHTRASEEADSERRPDETERTPDQLAARDRPPDARVLRVGAVVAHHEVAPGRNRYRAERLRRAAHVGLGQRHAAAAARPG